MADASIKIPIEIDDSKGLAQLDRFARKVEDQTDGIEIPINFDPSGAIPGFDKLGKAGKKNLTDIENAFLNVIKPIEQLEREMAALEAAIESTTDLALIKKFGDQLEKLKTQMNNIKVVGLESSLDKINGATGRAAAGVHKLNEAGKAGFNVITGFNRVIQDAPYGFNSIANNITELPGLFRSLSAAAKESGQSISKTLLQSLTGAGGIGFAISAITSAITFASIGFGAWTRGLTGSAKATKDAESETKKFSDTLKEVSGELARDAAKATELFSALTSGRLNMSERKQALKELQEVNKEYFGSLKEEEGVINGLSSAYDGYLARLTDIGKTKAIESQLTKLFDQKLQLELQVDPKFINATSSATQALIGTLKKNLNALGGPVDETKEKYDAFNETLNRRIQLQQKIVELEKGENVRFDGAKVISDQISIINLKIKGLQELLTSTGVFEIKDFKETKSGKDPFDEIINKAKQLAAFLDKNTQFSFSFEVDPNDTKEAAARSARLFIEKANEFLNQGTVGLFSFKQLAFREFPVELKVKFKTIAENIRKQAGIEATKTYEQVKKDFESEIKRRVENSPILMEIKLKFTDPGIKRNAAEAEFLNALGISEEGINKADSLLSKLRKGIIATHTLLKATLIPAFEGLFNAILEGQSPLQGFFDSLKQSINELIKKLLAAVIQASILSILTGGKIGFGKLFKQQLGIPFASGGLVSGPVLGLVGEGRGTSRNNPEVITPLDQLKSFFGGMINDITGRNSSAFASTPALALSIPSEVRLYASGRDLVGTIALENQSQRRNG